MRFVVTDGNDPKFMELCEQLDQNLNDLVGVVKELMERAISQNYRDMILETGRPLIAAQKLYQRLGFQIISNYGQYQCMGESICMKKTLQET